MVFTQDSFLVQFWLKQIRDGNKTQEDVPNLFNLQDVVNKVLNS